MLYFAKFKEFSTFVSKENGYKRVCPKDIVKILSEILLREIAKKLSCKIDNGFTLYKRGLLILFAGKAFGDATEGSRSIRLRFV